MIFKYLLAFFMLFFSTLVDAKTYNEWHLLYSNTFGTIKQVKDPQKSYKVTEFKSKSSRDTYINGAKKGRRAWHNQRSKIIEWEMKYRESYVIIISVDTLDGNRDLIYTSGSSGGVLYFGLGQKSIDGRWHTIRRDLEADLLRYEPNNSIVAVNAFIIRGSGRVGKIIMKEGKKSSKPKPKPKTTPKVPKKVQKVVPVAQPSPSKKEPISSKKDQMPIVSLKGGELLYHKLGEPFFDPGATARDGEGNPLSIDILGEVDINRVNRYVLSYVATDKRGNSTIETRVVMVYKTGKGAPKIKPKHVVQPTPPTPREEDLPILEEDGVGGAEDFPLTMEEIEALAEDMD